MLKQYFLLSCALVLLRSIGLPQNDSLFEVKGLHTKQLYDLMFDNRNQLWIGHELGLTRYDGNNFVRFTCPEQSFTGLSGIHQDRQGRIWCRNFASQVFYVENEKMHLLDSYDYKNEPRFPQMTIIGDQLICTSVKGLFILNTNTFKHTYLSCKGLYPTSFSVIGSKLIIFAMPSLFLFDVSDPHKGFIELTFDNTRVNAQNIVLQPFTNGDTMYSFSTVKRGMEKIVLKNNKLSMVGEIPSKGLFRTLNFSGKQLWLHSLEKSISLDKQNEINGFDLTDLVVDKEGNRWISSWSRGLFVQYRSSWKKKSLPFLLKDELVVKIEQHNQYNLFATSKCRLIIEDSNYPGKIKSINIPQDGSEINYIKLIDGKKLFISTDLKMYSLDIPNMSLASLTTKYFIAFKSMVKADSELYFATATALFKRENRTDNSGHEFAFSKIKDLRCRWVEYDKKTKNLIVAFKDGLNLLKGDSLIPVFYQGKEIAAVTMINHKDTIYISSFSDGLFKLDGERIKKLKIINDHRSNPIYTIKVFGNNLWLLGADFIKIFDPRAGKEVSDIIIPSLPDARILDIGQLNNNVILFTSKGIYQLKTSIPDKGYAIQNMLLKISVNGKDSIMGSDFKLPHNHNSLGFYLSAPFYTNSDQVFFRYRLIGSKSSEWTEGENGVTNFIFPSLKPGNYKFEAVAVHPQFGDADKPVLVEFSILPVWYQTTVFKIFFSLFIALAVILPLVIFFRYRLRHQKMNYEKQLAIKNERDRISAEIHDDIGAGLSGLRLSTELAAKSINDPRERRLFDRVYDSTTELSNKIQEVIWSLNTDNDTLENLLRYIEKQARKMFESTPINLEVIIPENIPEVSVSSQRRADMYLSVKEALHNALKHSGGSHVNLEFDITKDEVFILISDNGSGLKESRQAGNGLINMQKRIDRLGGIISFKNEKGLTVKFSIPV